ncbi:MAG TPA: DinB family protein [Bryobacteraceae bacterium]|nr:DinB family protein [Bryobacteraceae bacterium]
MERIALAEQLEVWRMKLLAACEDLSPKQWTFRCGEDQWTIAEVVEHIVMVERGISVMLQRKLMQSSPVDQVSSDLDERIRLAVVDRSCKQQTPERLNPSGKFPDGPAALEAFESTRAKTLEWFSTASDDLRRYRMPHPVLGPIDGYQWIVFVAAHAERHTLQIEEVKTASGYPAR